MTVLFETARCRVRELEARDVEAMYAVYGDAATMAALGDGETLDRATCARWVEVTNTNVATRGYGMSAVVRSADGETIGFCGLVHPGGQDDAEIKYAYRMTAWGHGLATEVGAEMLQHGRRAHGLTRVIATIAPGNLASQRVAEKLGMTRYPELDSEDARAFLWLASE